MCGRGLCDRMGVEWAVEVLFVYCACNKLAHLPVSSGVTSASLTFFFFSMCKYSTNSSDVKLLPWSVNISSGTPTRANSFTNPSVMCSAWPLGNGLHNRRQPGYSDSLAGFGAGTPQCPLLSVGMAPQQLVGE